MTPSTETLGAVGFGIEAIGVLCIFAGFVLSAIWFVLRLRREEPLQAYKLLRQDLARSILLGLEFLVAGDIIRTVTVEQTLTSAAILTLVVLIRILLSFVLEFDIEGRWPWQGRRRKA